MCLPFCERIDLKTRKLLAIHAGNDRRVIHMRQQHLGLRLPEGPLVARATTEKGLLPVVEAWVGVEQGRRPLHEGEALGGGAVVQLMYDPKGGSSVALAGRDDSGVIEVYTTNAPTGIGLVEAPFALTLDDSPGVQELFVVSSQMPLDELRVKAAILVGVPGARVGRLVIPKEAHR